MINFYCGTVLLLSILTLRVKADLEIHSGEHTYYKVEVQILELQNNNSQISNGKHCDTFTRCDPTVYAFLDLEKPVSPWPGAVRSLEDHEHIASHSNTDSISLNHVMGKSICGGGLNTANLRVEVYDHDYFTAHDLIEQFNCFFIPNVIADNTILATWSEVRDCKGLHNPRNTKLTYRWRVFILPASACGLNFDNLHTLTAASKQRARGS